MLTMSEEEVRIPSPAQLRRIRDRLGLSQAQMAAKVGVARRTWMYWENPRRNRHPSKSHAKLIALLADGKL
jgi:transcriptional regulator with XRE-family HTH domain